MEGEQRPTRLGDSAWTDIHSPLLALPIGSCEQHGPHLPLDTDTRIAIAVAEGLAKTATRVMVTPPLAMTSSGEHAGFAGTLSIGNDVLELTLVELARSADWSAGLVFVNGHGGNHAAVERAVARLGNEGRHVMSWWPRVPGGDAHAGRTETSLMLAIAPDSVRLDRAEVGVTAPIGAIVDRLRQDGIAAVSGNGVLGDPTGASAEEGRELLACFVDDIVAKVGSWAI
jgi:creatinine amidohydrolase